MICFFLNKSYIHYSAFYNLTVQYIILFKIQIDENNCVPLMYLVKCIDKKYPCDFIF